MSGRQYCIVECESESSMYLFSAVSCTNLLCARLVNEWKSFDFLHYDCGICLGGNDVYKRKSGLQNTHTKTNSTQKCRGGYC
jgi:hypothetical protein